MSFSKYCPICQSAKIYRKEVKTCGGVDCVNEWKGLNSSQKLKALEAAGIVDEVVSEVLELELPTAKEPQSVPEPADWTKILGIKEEKQ